MGGWLVALQWSAIAFKDESRWLQMVEGIARVCGQDLPTLKSSSKRICSLDGSSCEGAYALLIITKRTVNTPSLPLAQRGQVDIGNAKVVSYFHYVSSQYLMFRVLYQLHMAATSLSHVQHV